MKNNTVGVPVLKPGDIDKPLDNVVAIWVAGSPAEIGFLYRYKAQRAANGAGIGRT